MGGVCVPLSVIVSCNMGTLSACDTCAATGVRPGTLGRLWDRMWDWSKLRPNRLFFADGEPAQVNLVGLHDLRGHRRRGVEWLGLAWSGLVIRVGQGCGRTDERGV